jgi:hypothetical protein
MKHLIEFKLFETFSKDEVIQKASKYKSLLDLKKNNLKLYNLVVDNHLKNTIFPRKSKWTREEIEKESEKYNNRGDFSKYSQGAYVRAKGLNMLDELFPIS